MMRSVLHRRMDEHRKGNVIYESEKPSAGDPCGCQPHPCLPCRLRRKTEPDVPQPTQKPVEYANLTDEDSRALLSRLLENAGIDETRIRGLFDRVDQFNASVKSEWLTNGFERAVPTDTKYDPYEMQDLWAEKTVTSPAITAALRHSACSVSSSPSERISRRLRERIHFSWIWKR